MNELQLIESAASKRVLFCGERIIDVYHYVRPLGRPTKDAIVSVELAKDSEQFEGGVTAAAEHARGLVKELDLYSVGDVTVKERFVDNAHYRKLFQTYYLTDREPILPIFNIDEYDAVVVLDYGHGMANQFFIDSMVSAHYLAVNVQTNSGNYGFNLATKYPRADYLCVDEPEARLATQNRDGPIEDSIAALSTRARKVVVTLGKAGAIGYSADDGFVRVGAFTDTIVDTMGAGDAFFACTAVVAEHARIADICKIGNAAGALKSGILGHQRSIQKHELIELLQRHQPGTGASGVRRKRAAQV